MSIKQITQSNALNLFTPLILTKKLYIPAMNIGNNIEDIMKEIISDEIEGKCIKEGLIKPNSINIISFSSGQLHASNIIFEVLFEAQVCSPVEGMNISCIAKNITKAGIRAEIPGDYSPLVIFIARDHNYMSDYFNSIQENENINVKVLGQRYELNDKYISIIGSLNEYTNN